jgi:glycosyltransferase involved in cell wall biosynthesis
MFSTADWKARYWTNKQHTAEGLARRGWRVLYVESVGLRSPHLGSGVDWLRLLRRFGTGLRDFVLGPRQVAPSIWVLSPLVLPGQKSATLVKAINDRLLEGPILRFVRRNFSRPMVWTYHPFMMALPERMDASRIVYHCVDDIAAVPGVDASAYAAAEPSLIRAADVVFATSKPLLAKCAPLNPNSFYFSNVADVEHFGRAAGAGDVPADLAAIPGPRLGYHGVLSDFKIDFPLLRDLLRRRPDWHLVLLGEEREGQADPVVSELRSLPNAHFLGYRPYADLPDYLRGIDVGLLPVRANAYTRAMFPMKLYEYLAAGVPIVSAPAPFSEGPVPRLLVAAGAERFAAAIEEQLAKGRLSPEEARAAVGANTWDDRLTRMLAIAGAVSARTKAGPP